MKFPNLPNSKLKQNYLLYFETALIISLITFIGIFKIYLPANTATHSEWNIPDQELLHLEGIIRSTHESVKSNPPPDIYVANPVPKDEIIQTHLRDLDIELATPDLRPLQNET